MTNILALCRFGDWVFALLGPASEGDTGELRQQFGEWALGGIELVLWVLGALAAAGLMYLIYLDAGSPLRRQERARCFLHLLEVGLKQGQSIEQTIISLSQSRLQSLGVHFHLLAAYLETGLSLNAALEKVPEFLPAKVRAMLRVGEEIGDLPRVIPACRKTLKDGCSEVQKNMNNLAVLLFVCPLGAVLAWFCSIFILPRFKYIIEDFQIPLPLWTDQIFTLSRILSAVAIMVWLLFCFARLIDAGGPSFVSRFGKRLWAGSQRLSFWLPWRRKRMQRDFSVMLALLLDSEAPEAKAVRLAAASTANKVFMARAERAVRDLQAGVKLTEAVRWLDDAGEFRWRLRNASEPNAGFFAALTGWHESLEASAFHQEQAVSQSITTSFVMLNGLMVGLVALGIFRLLLALVGEATLW